MEDRPLRDDEYPDDETEQLPRQAQDLDAIDVAVGSGAYVYRHVLEECVERFPGVVARFPERFDRFYFAADGGPLLVDVLEDGTDEQQERSAVSKRVAFKREWCEEHGRRYLVLTETEAGDVNCIRALLDGAPARETAEETQTTAEKPKPARRARGKVQRPKAAA